MRLSATGSSSSASIAVRAPMPSVFVPTVVATEEDRIDGLGAPRLVGQCVACAQRLFLERIGNVAADETISHQAPDRRGAAAAAPHESRRSFRRVSRLVEKAAMQPRARAVLDRVADQRELHPRRPRSISRSKNRKTRVTGKSLGSIGSVRIVYSPQSLPPSTSVKS